MCRSLSRSQALVYIRKFARVTSEWGDRRRESYHRESRLSLCLLLSHLQPSAFVLCTIFLCCYCFQLSSLPEVANMLGPAKMHGCTLKSRRRCCLSVDQEFSKVAVILSTFLSLSTSSVFNSLKMEVVDDVIFLRERSKRGRKASLSKKTMPDPPKNPNKPLKEKKSAPKAKEMIQLKPTRKYTRRKSGATIMEADKEEISLVPKKNKGPLVMSPADFLWPAELFFNKGSTPQPSFSPVPIPQANLCNHVQHHLMHQHTSPVLHHRPRLRPPPDYFSHFQQHLYRGRNMMFPTPGYHNPNPPFLNYPSDPLAGYFPLPAPPPPPVPLKVFEEDEDYKAELDDLLIGGTTPEEEGEEIPFWQEGELEALLEEHYLGVASDLNMSTPPLKAIFGIVPCVCTGCTKEQEIDKILGHLLN